MKYVIDVQHYYSEECGEHLWCIYVDGKVFYRSPLLEGCLRALRLLNLGPVEHYDVLWKMACSLSKSFPGVEPHLVFALMVKVEAQR